MSEQWFYATSGTRHGPVSHEELCQQAALGQVQPNDLVWCEGMPQWVSARSVEGLLPVLPTMGVAAAPLATPAPLERWAGAGADQPAQTYPEAEPVYERRPEAGVRDIWRATQRSSGKSPKELQLLILGGVSILALVVVGIALAVFNHAVNDPGNIRSFPIRAGEAVSYEVQLEAGKKTQVWVTSERNTDIDLFVWDPYHRLIKKDERDFKDCYVEFVPEVTGKYRFDVRNININSKLPVGRNQCTLRVEPPAKLVSQR